MEKWKVSGKKWTLKEANALSPLQISAMTLPERAELANFYFRNFNLRVSTFVRAMEVPFALTKIFRDMEDIKNRPHKEGYVPFNLESAPASVSKGYISLKGSFAETSYPAQSLYSYINLMQEFFLAKSSTVKGWREIGLQQDIRLFGTDENGNPLNRLTDAERIKFWSIYHEAERNGFSNRYGYDSTQAHRAMAQLWQKGNFVALDIDAANATLDDMINNRVTSYPEHKPGVDGDFFQQNDAFADVEEGDYYDF